MCGCGRLGWKRHVVSTSRCLVWIPIVGTAEELVGATAILMASLLPVQVTLGLLTVILRKPADVASAHVAVGALLLVTTFVLTVRAARAAAGLSRPAETCAPVAPGFMDVGLRAQG